MEPVNFTIWRAFEGRVSRWFRINIPLPNIINLTVKEKLGRIKRLSNIAKNKGQAIPLRIEFSYENN